MELIFHLENFNKSVSFNKSNKHNEFHDVINEMEIFHQLCYPKFLNRTYEQNKPLTIEDNEFVWNSVKYLYVDITMQVRIQCPSLIAASDVYNAPRVDAARPDSLPKFALEYGRESPTPEPRPPPDFAVQCARSIEPASHRPDRGGACTRPAPCGGLGGFSLLA
jgi:hypothetical protein